MSVGVHTTTAEWPAGKQEYRVNLNFLPREELAELEWDEEAKRWDRPDIDRETLQELNKRGTAEGTRRVVVHLGLLAVIPFLAYSWLIGFLNGIEHEMRHKIVFPRQLDWLSDTIYFLIHLFSGLRIGICTTTRGYASRPRLED